MQQLPRRQGVEVASGCRSRPFWRKEETPLFRSLPGFSSRGTGRCRKDSSPAGRYRPIGHGQSYGGMELVFVPTGGELGGRFLPRPEKPNPFYTPLGRGRFPGFPACVPRQLSGAYAGRPCALRPHIGCFHVGRCRCFHPKAAKGSVRQSPSRSRTSTAGPV